MQPLAARQGKGGRLGWPGVTEGRALANFGRVSPFAYGGGFARCSVRLAQGRSPCCLNFV
jgi:hypothetical protein